MRPTNAGMMHMHVEVRPINASVRPINASVRPMNADIWPMLAGVLPWLLPSIRSMQNTSHSADSEPNSVTPHLHHRERHLATSRTTPSELEQTVLTVNGVPGN